MGRLEMLDDYKKCQTCKSATRTFDREDAVAEYYTLRCIRDLCPEKCSKYEKDDKAGKR